MNGCGAQRVRGLAREWMWGTEGERAYSRKGVGREGEGACSSVRCGAGGFEGGRGGDAALLTFSLASAVAAVRLTCIRIRLHSVATPTKPCPSLQVQDMGFSIPPLCSCSAAQPFDPAYVMGCARNCPLYRNPQQYENLLNSILDANDVL